MSENNPVKEILYDFLKKQDEDKIKKYISEKNSSELINQIITHCYPKVQKLKNDVNENTCIFLTGTLHYLLTNFLIPSQRKIEQNGIELDIVIPDQKTLNTKPKNALIICIPKSFDYESINKNIKDLQKNQPVKENIWIVLKEPIQTDFKIFAIKNGTMNNILNEISSFLDNTRQTQFKIFKSNLV